MYRNCRNSSQKSTLAEREEEALEKVRQKLVDRFMDEGKIDLYFIVGNLKNHSKTFMIIGLFYPPFKSQLELGI